MVKEKQKEKVEKYHDLKKEIRRLWKLRNVEIVPAVIGALEVFLQDLIGGWES